MKVLAALIAIFVFMSGYEVSKYVHRSDAGENYMLGREQGRKESSHAPSITQTQDFTESGEISNFLNGLDVRCPDGYGIVDPNHTLHPNMSYRETFNALVRLSCGVNSPNISTH